MAIPAVVAHGGAGAGPERLANVERAVAIAAGILDSGGSAIEAAVEACVVLEDDPVFNAGTGSVFRTDGSVHLDASTVEDRLTPLDERELARRSVVQCLRCVGGAR